MMYMFYIALFNRDIPVFVTIPMIFSCINKIIPYGTGKTGAGNSVVNELKCGAISEMGPT